MISQWSIKRTMNSSKTLLKSCRGSRKLKLWVKSQLSSSSFSNGHTSIKLYDFRPYQFVNLNSKVPTEFDYDGNAVRYADKNILYTLPGVMTIAYIIITVLQLVPHRFNYDCVGLTVFNAQEVYRATRMILLYCKIMMELMFTFITLIMLEVVQYECESQRMYYAFLFVIPYLVGGVFYYRKLKIISTQSQV